jgi:hypothetical protein
MVNLSLWFPNFAIFFFISVGLFVENECTIIRGCQCARRGLGIIFIRELGLWRLTSLSTICQLYRDDHYVCLRKQEYPEKTTDLSQVTVKLYNIMLYRVHAAMCGVRTLNVSGDRL